MIAADGVLPTVALGWWVVSLAVFTGSCVLALLQPRLRGAVRPDRPPLSIVIPVQRLEPDLEEAFESAFRCGYPEVEVIAVAAEANSPALALFDEVRRRFPAVSSSSMQSTVREAVSPKLNNLVPALAAARHDLILVKDSNVRLSAGQVDDVVASLTDGVGLVATATVGIRPECFGAQVECTFLNGCHARLLLAASSLGRGFGNGKILLFDRREWDRSGGMAAVAHSVAEDHAISKSLARIGLRTVMAPMPAVQSLRRRNLRDVWTRQLRWMVCRRFEEPWAFLVEPFFAGLFTAVAGGFGASALGIAWWWVAAATLVFWCALEMAFLAAKGWPRSFWTPLACLSREGLIVALWLRAWTTRRVVWNGVAMDVHGRVPRPKAAGGP